MTTESRSKARSIESDLKELRELPEVAGLGNFHATPLGGRRLFGPIWWFQGDLWWATSTLLVRPIPTLLRWIGAVDKGKS